MVGSDATGAPTHTEPLPAVALPPVALPPAPEPPAPPSLSLRDSGLQPAPTSTKAVPISKLRTIRSSFMALLHRLPAVLGCLATIARLSTVILGREGRLRH